MKNNSGERRLYIHNRHGAPTWTNGITRSYLCREVIFLFTVFAYSPDPLNLLRGLLLSYIYVHYLKTLCYTSKFLILHDKNTSNNSGFDHKDVYLVRNVFFY